MPITLVSDPIIDVATVNDLLALKDKERAKLLINSLTEKFMRYTGRVALASAAIVEQLRGQSLSPRLWLHATPIDTGQTVEAQLYIDGTADETYTLTDGDIQVWVNNGRGAAIELLAGEWPLQSDRDYVEVSYTGGWTATPGDVLEGAILQGKVDMRRFEGEVGIETKAREGEATKYDTASIIKPVRELWRPYRILV